MNGANLLIFGDIVSSNNTLLDNFFIFILLFFINNLTIFIIFFKHQVFNFNSISKSRTWTIFLSLVILAFFYGFDLFQLMDVPNYVAWGFKFVSVLLLILINLFLIMAKNKESFNKERYLQSGLGLKNREKLAVVVGYVLGNIGSIITLKNEYKEQKINNLNKEIQKLINEIKVSNTELEILKQKIADQ